MVLLLASANLSELLAQHNLLNGYLEAEFVGFQFDEHLIDQRLIRELQFAPESEAKQFAAELTDDVVTTFGD